MNSGTGASKRVNFSPCKAKNRHSGKNRSPDDDLLFLWSEKTQSPLRQCFPSAHKVGFVWKVREQEINKC